MQILKSRTFKNGMTKKVKHIMGNTFEVQYSNCILKECMLSPLR